VHDAGSDHASRVTVTSSSKLSKLDKASALVQRKRPTDDRARVSDRRSNMFCDLRMSVATRTFSDKDVQLARYTLSGSRLDDRWCLGGQFSIRRSGTASIRADVTASVRTCHNASTHTNQLKDNGVSESGLGNLATTVADQISSECVHYVGFR